MNLPIDLLLLISSSTTSFDHIPVSTVSLQPAVVKYSDKNGYSTFVVGNIQISRSFRPVLHQDYLCYFNYFSNACTYLIFVILHLVVSICRFSFKTYQRPFRSHFFHTKLTEPPILLDQHFYKFCKQAITRIFVRSIMSLVSCNVDKMVKI